MSQRKLSTAIAAEIFMAVVVLAAALGGVSNARAADAICAGSFSGNITGNVFVGSGVSCTISQANIGGNVQLKAGAR